MKITHIPGDGDAYQVPAKLVNWLVYAILGSLVTIGGYMVVWNRTDTAWKAVLMERIDAMSISIAALRTKVEVGVLPVAEQRLDSLDYRLQMIERTHENGSTTAPKQGKP